MMNFFVSMSKERAVDWKPNCDVKPTIVDIAKKEFLTLIRNSGLISILEASGIVLHHSSLFFFF